MVTVGTIYPSSLLVQAIEAYQRFISPYKGFRCAHRTVHGRDSCSQFAKRIATRRGILRLFPLLRRRFAECTVAAQVLDHESRAGVHLRRQDSSCTSTLGDAAGEACVQGACHCGPDLACGLLDGI